MGERLAGFPATYARALREIDRRPGLRALDIEPRRIGAQRREIYVILWRLERKGVVKSKVVPGRPHAPDGVALSYAPTPLGKRALAAWELLRALGPGRGGGQRRRDSAR